MVLNKRLVRFKDCAGPHCLLPLGSFMERPGYGYYGGTMDPDILAAMSTVGVAVRAGDS